MVFGVRRKKVSFSLWVGSRARQKHLPEQFYQSANNANNAILLIVVLAGLLTVRGKYVPGKFIGIFCILICLGLFIHGCGHVGARF